MRKIIFNYHTPTNTKKRLEVYRDLPFSKEIIYSMLFLHKAKIISLDNVLNVKEYFYA